ncbi:MAG: phosphate acyltransferase PlsX [Syntrophomonadaceae bacterium]|nr:phosphate acyltransferase PlsX [Syntrophomonadaceae bacterium]
MRVALDAMGGDFAPRELVAGAVEAINNLDLRILLVGQEERLQEEISRLVEQKRIERSLLEEKLEIIPAGQVIGMDEEPVMALRKKKDASIVVATRLVKDGLAEAVVSAGSTGAQMAAALLILGRMPGVERPAIVTVLPGKNGPKLLLDAGANVDCRPKHLEQFSLMGSIYASAVLGLKNPGVGLLNIGEEEGKGNELTKQTYQLLKEAPVRFIGNIEGRELLTGEADIIVCDGFVGNVVLKLTEGLARTLFEMIKEELSRNARARAGAALILPGLKNLKQRLDYAEYGGAPLLGVKGISIICHGSSQARAIYNAIRVAKESIENRLVDKLSSVLVDQ